jgi:hypothetical protein
VTAVQGRTRPGPIWAMWLHGCQMHPPKAHRRGGPRRAPLISAAV